MITAKIASRNVTFKAAKMSESIFAGQSSDILLLILEIEKLRPQVHLLTKRTWKTS